MTKLAELFKKGNFDELWDRCCGFIDLKLEDFMKIQSRLLFEQLDMLKNCEMGRDLLKGAVPTSLKEFREQVPLTSYADYAPYLLKRRMDVLPKKPVLWQYTSGKSGEYSYRWAPVTGRMLDEIEPLIFAMLFFSSCKKRKDIAFRTGDKVLYGMAPPPYATGTMTRVFPNELFTFLPPVEEAEQTQFDERIKKGFDMGLEEGMDLCFAMSSVTVAIGDRFKHSGSQVDMKALVKKPRKLLRLARAKLLAKLAGRTMLPRDLWKLKGLITFGIDGAVYREKIKEMWGRYPLDMHGCTEAPIIAMQTWDHKGLTFVPNLNFYEFIPEAEALKSNLDPTYKPRTYLMNELCPGKYELVITSFHGGAFLRYRLGHLVEITSLRNDEIGIDLPQMQFLSRIDDQIDIAGFTRLSEKVIWQALENSDVPYVEWTARKEISAGEPVLRVYVEMGKGCRLSAAEIAARLHDELKKLDAPYAELEDFTGLKPLSVTLLGHGAFKLFKLRQQSAGADLASQRAPHLSASDETVEFLTGTASAGTVRLMEKVGI